MVGWQSSGLVPKANTFVPGSPLPFLMPTLSTRQADSSSSSLPVAL